MVLHTKIEALTTEQFFNSFPLEHTEQTMCAKNTTRNYTHDYKMKTPKIYFEKSKVCIEYDQKGKKSVKQLSVVSLMTFHQNTR